MSQEPLAVHGSGICFWVFEGLAFVFVRRGDMPSSTCFRARGAPFRTIEPHGITLEKEGHVVVASGPAAATASTHQEKPVFDELCLFFSFRDRCFGPRVNVRSFYRMLDDSPPQWILTHPEEAAPRTGDGLFPGDVVEVVQVWRRNEAHFAQNQHVRSEPRAFFLCMRRKSPRACRVGYGRRVCECLTRRRGNTFCDSNLVVASKK